MLRVPQNVRDLNTSAPFPLLWRISENGRLKRVVRTLTSKPSRQRPRKLIKVKLDDRVRVP